MCIFLLTCYCWSFLCCSWFYIFVFILLLLFISFHLNRFEHTPIPISFLVHFIIGSNFIYIFDNASHPFLQPLISYIVLQPQFVSFVFTMIFTLTLSMYRSSAYFMHFCIILTLCIFSFVCLIIFSPLLTSSLTFSVPVLLSLLNPALYFASTSQILMLQHMVRSTSFGKKNLASWGHL